MQAGGVTVVVGCTVAVYWATEKIDIGKMLKRLTGRYALDYVALALFSFSAKVECLFV